MGTCFFKDQEMYPPAISKTKPPTECLVSTLPAQSESVQPAMSIASLPITS